MSSSTDEFLSLKYSIVRIPLKKRERERLLKHVRSTAPFLKKHIVKTVFCGHVLGKQFTGEWISKILSEPDYNYSERTSYTYNMA